MPNTNTTPIEYTISPSPSHAGRWHVSYRSGDRDGYHGEIYNVKATDDAVREQVGRHLVFSGAARPFTIRVKPGLSWRDTMPGWVE